MNKIRYFIALAMLSVSVASVAQNLSSGYFTDGYLYRHDMNPAIGNDQSYIAFPALGNLNVDVSGTLGLKDVLYNRNGKTTTFLNPNVSVDEFVGNIKDKNKLNESLRMQILGAGFKGFGGYNTFEINVREDLNTILPGTLLRAMKEGLTNQTYEFSDLYASAKAYAEIAFGHSHQVSEKLRIGAKAKVLVAVGAAELNVNKAQLTFGEDKYTANVDADLNVNLKDVTFKHDVNENTGHHYVSGVDDESIGVNGIGFAVDLGAEYKLNDDWKFSAAVLDLGFINYSTNYLATTNGEKTFDTSKYTFNVDDDATNNFDDELDKMQDDLSSLYELEDKGDQGSKKIGLGTTFNVGAEYTCPFYRNLTIGLLNTTRTGSYSWTNFRLSANVAPVKIFSAGVNVSTGTYGTAFGWIVNFHPKGFNLFVGMDKMLGSLCKQGIPLSSNANVSMGINFPL